MGIDTGNQTTTRYEDRGDAYFESDICIIGLGYVGLRLAMAFDAADYSVEGYDVDSEKIAKLRDGVDPTGEVSRDVLEERDVRFTDEPNCIGRCEYVVIAVPTPIDDSNTPDMSIVRAAGRTVGEYLSAGTTVVLESTVSPGTTRGELIPELEASSGMVAGEDFSVGYSPERIVPGDDSRSLRDIVKIVSAQDRKTLADLQELYGTIVDAGIHPAPTIEVAEAAKCLENTQRDLNIALVNEFALACRQTDVDVEPEAVIEAAGTKWNFQEYQPGLVGGHCLPVDPYFLIHSFETGGFNPSLIRTGRTVNEAVPEYVAEMTVDALAQRTRTLVRGKTDGGTDSRLGEETTTRGSDDRDRVLVGGLAYKPNTSDVRSSAVGEVIEHLRGDGREIVGADPRCDSATIEREFDVPVQEGFSVSGFDAFVVATPHDELRDLDLERISREMNDRPVLVDVKGAFDAGTARDAGFIYRRL